MEELSRFEHLMKQRSFKSLSEEEKEFAFQFISSEDEYESLRNAELELRVFFERQQKLQPRVETLVRIKQSRAGHFVSQPGFWVRPAVPAYAVALVIVVVGAIGWWSGTRFGSEKVMVEKIVSRTDTIRVASKPDTIIKEKIVYFPSPKVILASQPETKETGAARGVNMKDKEELERLLVSGTY